MKRNYWTAVVLLMVFINNTKAQETLNNDLRKENLESEYYYAFTEATKHMIYQNFPQAISLYRRCLEYNPGSAAIKYQLSMIYFRVGDMNLARSLGKEACAADPDNRWYLIHLIKLYQTSNQIDSAIIYNSLLIGLEPGNAENLLNLGILYQINGDSRKALDLYDEMERNYGRNSEIYVNRYKIYRTAGKNGKALKQLEYARGLSQDDAELLGMMAEHYRDLGDEKKAEGYYQMLLQTDKNGLTIISYLQHLLKFERYREAFHFYASALEQEDVKKEEVFVFLMNEMGNSNIEKERVAFLDTAIGFLQDQYRDDIRIQGLYVDYQFKRSRFELASAMLKQMLTGNERNYRIWEQIIFAENALGHFDSVLFYGERVIEAFDRESVPYLYTGIAYQQLKQGGKSIRLLERGLQLTDNANLMLQYSIFLAEAYNDSGDTDRAFDYYEKALSLDGNNIMVMNNYAYFLALAGKDLEKAEKMSRYTIEKEKKNYIYLDTYAWIMFKMKRRDMARKYIKKAMRFGGEKSNEVLDHYRVIME